MGVLTTSQMNEYMVELTTKGEGTSASHISTPIDPTDTTTSTGRVFSKTLDGKTSTNTWLTKQNYPDKPTASVWDLEQTLKTTQKQLMLTNQVNSVLEKPPLDRRHAKTDHHGSEIDVQMDSNELFTPTQPYTYEPTLVNPTASRGVNLVVEYSGSGEINLNTGIDTQTESETNKNTELTNIGQERVVTTPYILEETTKLVKKEFTAVTYGRVVEPSSKGSNLQPREEPQEDVLFVNQRDMNSTNTTYWEKDIIYKSCFNTTQGGVSLKALKKELYITLGVLLPPLITTVGVILKMYRVILKQRITRNEVLQAQIQSLEENTIFSV